MKTRKAGLYVKCKTILLINYSAKKKSEIKIGNVEGWGRWAGQKESVSVREQPRNPQAAMLTVAF